MDSLAPLSKPSKKDAPVWRRSSFCRDGNCIEVASESDCEDVLVRSSLARALTLRFTRSEWVAFVAGVRAGEFDSQ
jgi:hypothetical protein